MFNCSILLIAPEGIEIEQLALLKGEKGDLLIAPEGIEISEMLSM